MQPLWHWSESTPDHALLLLFSVDLQRYVSPDLTHFVGASLRNQSKQFLLLKKIIRQGVLKARPKAGRLPRDVYDHAKYVDRKLSSNQAYKGAIVCFCDIPLADLYLHMDKYSRFGIAFRKTFLAEQGVAPVMYVPKLGRPSLLHFHDWKRNTPIPTRGISSQAVAFDRFFDYLNAFGDQIAALEDAKLIEAWRRIVGFLDLGILSNVKFFDHRLHEADEENFYMEREWRSSKSVEFDLYDVQRIIVPSKYGRPLRDAFPEYDGELFFAD